MWMLTLTLRDLTSDFKLRVRASVFLPSTSTASVAHTQSAGKKWKLLQVCQFSANPPQTNSVSESENSTSYSNAMAIFFFCVSDKLYTREEKKHGGFPLGES